MTIIGRYQPIILAILLLFGLWAIRQIDIESFPPFVDEGVHLRMAEDQRWISPLIHAQQGRLLTLWIYAATQAYSGGTFWLARTVTLLALLPGIAALMGIGKLAAGWRGAMLAGLLLLFSTYHQFFDRLAMGDSLAAGWVSVGLYFAYRLSRRCHRTDAALAGVALFLALGAKVTILPYYGLPVAAALTLGWGRVTLRQRASWLLMAMGVLLGITGIFVIGLQIFGYDFFFLFGHHNPTTEASPLATMQANLGMLLGTATGFLGPVMVVACMLALCYLLYQRDFFLPLALLAPAIAMTLSAKQSTRFYEAPITILLVVGAIGLARMTRNAPPARYALTAAIIVWGLITWLPFTLAANRDAGSMPLYEPTYNEYLRGDGSGVGIEDARSVLLANGAQTVFGILPNCQGLRYTTLGQFEVVCPRVNPNREDIPALAALLEANRAPGNFAVLEDSAYVPETAPGAIIATLQPESGRPALTIYDLGQP